MKINQIVIAVLLSLVCRLSFADDQAAFIVSGNIAKTNQPDRKTYIFSIEKLRKLPNGIVVD